MKKATIMNIFFFNITKELELKKDSKGKLNNLEDILKAYESHQSIEKIKKAINTNEFSFSHIIKPSLYEIYILTC